MILTFVFADSAQEWNTSNWRCVIPAKAINRAGRHHVHLIGIGDFSRNTPESQSICSQSDIIVVERNLFGDTLSAIQYWKARDKVVVANFDDAYQLMHPSNISYNFWNKGEVNTTDQNGVTTKTNISPIPLTAFKWGLRMIDAAVVSSKILVKDWEEYTDVYYLPNYLDTDIYLHSEPAVPHEGIYIGWGGSLSHFQSFTDSGILLALKQVLRARPQARLLICGNKSVYERIDLLDSQKKFQDFVPFEKWATVLRTYDIGLAPLHGLYDGRRSWIKPLEYMLLKIPWLASDNIAYQDISSFGNVVKNTPKAWEAALLDMIDHLEGYREKAAGEPYQYALQQGANENVDNILNIYAEIYRKSTGKNLAV